MVRGGPGRAPRVKTGAAPPKSSEPTSREATVNLHKRLHGISYKKRAPRAVREIKAFATEMMGTKDVRVRVCVCVCVCVQWQRRLAAAAAAARKPRSRQGEGAPFCACRPPPTLRLHAEAITPLSAYPPRFRRLRRT